MGLDEFTEATIRKWLVAHRHLSKTSLQTYDRAIRVLASWLYQRGYVGQHPMANLPKPKAKATEIVTFTESDVRAMVSVAKCRQYPLRDIALIMLLLDTGIRIGEAMSLCLQDIQWVENCIHVDGKSGERTVPFGRKAKQALKRYIDLERKAASPSIRHVFLNRSGVGLDVTAATHHIRKIAKQAGVKATKIGPHTFRHSFAVEFIRAGGDAFTLQRILGHSTLDMTRRYVHLAQSDLRAAHRKFAPGDRML